MYRHHVCFTAEIEPGSQKTLEVVCDAPFEPENLIVDQHASRGIWIRMHFDDWPALPSPVRARFLSPSAASPFDFAPRIVSRIALDVENRATKPCAFAALLFGTRHEQLSPGELFVFSRQRAIMRALLPRELVPHRSVWMTSAWLKTGPQG